MAENSKIEWCDHTFNPWRGCTKVSPGCANCYAARDANRYKLDCFGPGKPRIRTSPSNWKLPLRWNRQAQTLFTSWEAFKSEYPGMTDRELEEQGFIKPVRPKVFCASWADVFDSEVSDEWRIDLFELILKTPYLDWLILTKRIENVEKLTGLVAEAWELASEFVWLGATVESPHTAWRIPILLRTPAAKHFLSMEPLLDYVDLEKAGAWPSEIVGIDWVIVGGESGPHARPVHPDWVRRIQADCEMFSTPFFFKQWGEWASESSADLLWVEIEKLKSHRFEQDAIVVFRCGKSRSGRLLDGREHMKFPEV